MSTRLQFKKEQIENERIKSELSNFVGDLYDDNNNRYYSLVKESNDSFYEIGMDAIYGQTKQLPEKTEFIDRYFSNDQPCFAREWNYKSIANYIAENKEAIERLENDDRKNWKAEADNTKHLIKLLKFLASNKIDLILA